MRRRFCHSSRNGRVRLALVLLAAAGSLTAGSAATADDKIAAVLKAQEVDFVYRSIKTAIQINGADERFKRVRQSRCSLAPTTGFLAASHQKVTSQIERSGVHLQRFAGNEPGTQFCQLSFGFGTKAAKEMFANHKLKDSVAEKFQALIIKMIALSFMAQTGMRERLRQEE